MAKITPLPGYCLVEPIESENKSGDIILPETDKDKPSKGVVVDYSYFSTSDSSEWSGDGYVVNTIIKTGKKVIYKKYTNQEIEEDGKKYLIIPFKDLLAVYE